MTASITDVISDPRLLGPAFAGDSWATWRAVIRAAEGLPLDETDLSRFHAVAGDRSPPGKRVRELWAIGGRRSGKDSVASGICTALALGDYRASLRPGEKALVMCLAVDRDQARIVLDYVRGYFATNALLKPLIARETGDGLELVTGTELVIATNSYRAVRGRTLVGVVFDEVGYWRSEEAANPDREVLNAVLPAMVTLPASMLVGISSPYRRSGLLYDRWREHYGQPSDDVLVVRGASTAFNPSLPQSVIDQALARDPAAARSEWLAEWRDDVGAWLPRDLIMAAVDAGVARRPPDHRWRYVAFADPSGGRDDAFAVAIAHLEGARIVLDVLYEKSAPFDPSQAVAEVAQLLRQYRLSAITGDAYGAEWVVAAFRERGVTYRPSELNRSEIYLNALPLFSAGRARLLDHDRLVRQFLALERRVMPGGRDRVDHPDRGGHHDDLSNAVSGALTLLGGQVDVIARWIRAFGGVPVAPSW